MPKRSDRLVAPPNHDAVEAQYNDRSKHKKGGASINLAAAFTCLQFIFAMYVTILLFFFMGGRLDIATKPETTSSSLELHKQYLRGAAGSSTPPPLVMATPVLPEYNVCIHEESGFRQKVSHDTAMLSIKQNLYVEMLRFQQRTRGCETLQELLNLPSRVASSRLPKVTVILNHYKRKALCAQIQALQVQTLPFHRLWVLAFNSSITNSLQAMVEALHDARISFVASNYNFKYYGRFQLALQVVHDADYVYFLDDDMIPGKKMLEILTHAAGTSKYRNAVLGSVGRILPFRQKDYSFPSYHKYGIREAGLYLPDPAYGIDVVEHVLQVDFLTSSWFLGASLVKAIFIETPFTFTTGEDLHLSYQLQKYEGAGSFVIPVDPKDKDTWGDTEHRFAYVSENTLIHKDIIQLRDKQWWKAMSKGFFTQWAAMYPQQCDAFFYAHSMDEVVNLTPLIQRFRMIPGKKAYVVVAGGNQCPCEDAALQLGWTTSSCYDRRFKIFDLGINDDAVSHVDVTLMRYIVASMEGLLKIHSPTVLVTVADVLPTIVQNALLHAANDHSIVFIQVPKPSIPHCLWMADLKPYTLRQWDKMKISVSIITQDRPKSLQRLLGSMSQAMYVGDRINLSIHMDSRVTKETLKIVNQFEWPHGDKQIRSRIIQAGLIRAVSESWYPSSDNEFGLLLEDDIEVSPFYYIWMKYCLLSYHYNQQQRFFPELASIALYTPRVVEVVKERPRWNATKQFQGQWHPHTPYLHQLPCSWGALFFPKHWKEFYRYMALHQHTTNNGTMQPNLVQIPHSRTNGWQGSWKKHLIDLMYLRGYVTLYPNFPNQTSFSTNHMEPGTHINAYGNRVEHKWEDFEVPLMQDDFLTLLPEHKLPEIAKLPIINLFNKITTIQELKEAGSRLNQDVLRCKPSEVVAVDYESGEATRCMPV